MGQCCSCTVSERPEVSQWYSDYQIDDLKRNVEQWDVLEIKLIDDPPLYGGALVLGRSGNDLQLAQFTVDSFSTDQEDYKFSNVLLEEAIADRIVRINNKTFGAGQTGSAQHGPMQHFMLSVMAHFLRNTITPFIGGLAEEIRSRYDNPHTTDSESTDSEPTVSEFEMAQAGPASEVEQLDAFESESRKLIASILIILVELARSGLENHAEKNKNEGKVSGWFDRHHIKNLESELCLGDKLEFKRRFFYSHWGICLGKLGGALLVVHFSTAGRGKKYLTNKSFGLRSSAKDAPVYRIDSIEKPLGNHRVRINNILDSTYPSLPSDVILSGVIDLIEAQSFQASPKYSVLRNNCEHLVNELRHREHLSEQVPPMFNQASPAL